MSSLIPETWIGPEIQEDWDLNIVGTGLSLSTFVSEYIYLQELETLVRSLFSALPWRAHEWDRIFTVFKTLNNKDPKKEFFRLMIIRGHRNLLRKTYENISKNRDNLYPTKKINFVKKNSPIHRRLWQQLIDLSRANDLEAASRVDNGPKTQNEEPEIPNDTAEKSFNDAFLRSYFLTEGVRQSWSAYIELIFSETELGKLCEKFRIKCCKGEHSSNCWQRWKLMKMYLSIGIMTTLNIEPINHWEGSLNPQEVSGLIFSDFEFLLSDN